MSEKFDRYIENIEGRLELTILDDKGNVVRTIEKKNADTLVAKFRVGSTIYTDFVIRPFEEIFGSPFSEIVKTCYKEVSEVRSGKLSTQFSLDSTNKLYTATLNFTNTDAVPLRIYGLVSYNTTDNFIFTMLDLTDENIVIQPNYMLVGKYVIQYNESSPSLTNYSNSTTTVQDNTIIGVDTITPDLRKYKLTRNFTQTKIAYGVDTADIPESAIQGQVITSNSLGKAFGDDSQFGGEWYYKITVDGQPGTAKAKKFMLIPFIDGGVTDSQYKVGDIVTYVDSSDFFFNPYEREIEIKPLKIKILQVPSDIIDTINLPSNSLGFYFYNKPLRIYYNPDITTKLRIFRFSGNAGSLYIYKPDGTLLSKVAPPATVNLPSDVDNIFVSYAYTYNPNITYYTVFSFITDGEAYIYGSWLPGNPDNPSDILVVGGTDLSMKPISTLSIIPQFYSTTPDEYEAGKSFGIFNRKITIPDYQYGRVAYPIGVGYINLYSGYYDLIAIPEGLITPTEGDNYIELTLDDILLPAAHTGQSTYGVVYNSETGKFEVKDIENEITEETIEQTETIGNLTISFSDTSTFKAGEYWKFTINDSDSLLLVDKLEKWQIINVSSNKYENEFWKENTNYVGLANRDSLISGNTDLQSPKEITDLPIPQFNIYSQDGFKPNKIAVFEIPWDNSTADRKYTLLIPKKITDSETGEELYVNAKSVYVTDGHRYMPSEPRFYPDSIVDDIDVETNKEYFKVKLDYGVLKELYQESDNKKKILLYAFFEAKSLDELLPYETKLSMDKDSTEEAVYPILLPFEVDGKIEVINSDTGESYQFQLVNSATMETITEEGETGNLLLIKAPIIKGCKYVRTDYQQINTSTNYSYSSLRSDLPITYDDNQGIGSFWLDGYQDTLPIAYSYEYNAIPYTRLKRIKIIRSDTFNATKVTDDLSTNLGTTTIFTFTELGKYRKLLDQAPDNTLAIVGFIHKAFGLWVGTGNHLLKYEGYTADNTIVNNLYRVGVARVRPLDYMRCVYFGENTELDYATIDYKPLTIVDIPSDSINLIQRSPSTIFNKNKTPIRIIEGIKQPVRLLTKFYNTDKLEGGQFDVRYPLTSLNDPIQVSVAFYDFYKRNYYTKILAKSEELRNLFSLGYRASGISPVSEETYNSLERVNDGVTIETSDSITDYYLLSTGNFISGSNYIKAFDSEFLHFTIYGNYHLQTQNFRNLTYNSTELTKLDSPISPVTIYSSNIAKSDDVIVYGKFNQYYAGIVMATEEIPVDNINWLHSIQPIIQSSPRYSLQLFPVIKIRNTETGETHYYTLTWPNKVKQIDYFINKLQTTNQPPRVWFNYLQPGTSLIPFNDFIETYKDGNGTYTLSVGVLIRALTNGVMRLEGLSLMAEFTDDSLYDEIPYCFINTKAYYLTDDITEITPDPTNNIVKVYNPNDYTINIPVRTSLKKAGIDTTQFTDGIVAKNPDTNTNLPVCYVSKYGTEGKPTDNFANWNGDEIYVKVEIPAKSIVSIQLENGIQTATLSDLFDFVFNVENFDKDNLEWSYIPPEVSGLSWSQNIDLGGTDTDGDGTEDYHTYGSEVGCFYCLYAKDPISVTDNKTLIIRGENNTSKYHGFYTKDTISGVVSKKFVVRFKFNNDSSYSWFYIGFDHSSFTSTPSTYFKKNSIFNTQANHPSIGNVDLGYRGFGDEWLTYKLTFNGRCEFDSRPKNEFKLDLYIPGGFEDNWTKADISAWLTETNIGLFYTSSTTDYQLELDYIYAVNKYDFEPIVLYEDDIGIAIPEDNYLYLFIDKVNYSNPDKTTIETIIDNWKTNFGDRVYRVQVTTQNYPLWAWNFHDGYREQNDPVRGNISSFVRYV